MSAPKESDPQGPLCTVSMASKGWTLRPTTWELLIYRDAIALVRHAPRELYGAVSRGSLKLGGRRGREEVMRHLKDRARERERSGVAHVADLDTENLVIASDEITRARLRRGILFSRLRIELADGRSFKVLWMRRDPNRINPAVKDVEDALRQAFGSRLEVS